MVATLGLVFPCLVIIMLIAAFLQNFAEQPVVVHAFNGVRACVCALILSSVLKLRKSTVVDGPTAGVFAVMLVLAVLGSFVSFPAGWAGSVLSFLCSPWCWWWPMRRGWTVHPGGEGRAAAVIYLQLFFEFFKAGLFAIGGGLATIPFLTDIGQRTGWFTSGELANMIAISESTPGPMGVNMATYVGFHTGGIAGALSPPWAWCAPPSSSSWSSRAF